MPIIFLKKQLIPNTLSIPFDPNTPLETVDITASVPLTYLGKAFYGDCVDIFYAVEPVNSMQVTILNNSTDAFAGFFVRGGDTGDAPTSYDSSIQYGQSCDVNIDFLSSETKFVYWEVYDPATVGSNMKTYAYGNFCCRRVANSSIFDIAQLGFDVFTSYLPSNEPIINDDTLIYNWLDIYDANVWNSAQTFKNVSNYTAYIQDAQGNSVAVLPGETTTFTPASDRILFQTLGRLTIRLVNID